MPIAIKLTDNNVPPVCLKLLIDLAKHIDECLDCTMANMNHWPAEKYCKDGYAILEELGKQPEVYQC